MVPVQSGDLATGLSSMLVPRIVLESVAVPPGALKMPPPSPAPLASLSAPFLARVQLCAHRVGPWRRYSLIPPPVDSPLPLTPLPAMLTQLMFRLFLSPPPRASTLPFWI